MKIREHKDMIELVAEDKSETELLRRVFQGEGPYRYRINSFGYDRHMPRRKAQKEGKLQWWADRQMLVFRLNVQSKGKPNNQPFAECLKCHIKFHDTEHGRKTGVWCPHLTFLFSSGAYYLDKGKLKDVRFLNNPNFF